MVRRAESGSSETVALGFDFGTSGARCCAVVGGEQVDASAIKWECAADCADPEAWTTALDEMIMALPQQVWAR